MRFIRASVIGRGYKFNSVSDTLESHHVSRCEFVVWKVQRTQCAVIAQPSSRPSSLRLDGIHEHASSTLSALIILHTAVEALSNKCLQNRRMLVKQLTSSSAELSLSRVPLGRRRATLLPASWLRLATICPCRPPPPAVSSVVSLLFPVDLHSPSVPTSLCWWQRRVLVVAMVEYIGLSVLCVCVVALVCLHSSDSVFAAVAASHIQSGKGGDGPSDTFAVAGCVYGRFALTHSCHCLTGY